MQPIEYTGRNHDGGYEFTLLTSVYTEYLEPNADPSDSIDIEVYTSLSGVFYCDNCGSVITTPVLVVENNPFCLLTSPAGCDEVMPQSTIDFILTTISAQN